MADSCEYPPLTADPAPSLHTKCLLTSTPWITVPGHISNLHFSTKYNLKLIADKNVSLYLQFNKPDNVPVT
jgi:hypothetical protein